MAAARYSKSAQESFERLKSIQTISTAGGVIVTPPIMEQVFKLSPETFGQKFSADGTELLDSQRLARTGARLAVAVVIGAVGLSMKNEIAKGVGFGVGIGALASIMRDWGVDF